MIAYMHANILEHYSNLYEFVCLSTKINRYDYKYI